MTQRSILTIVAAALLLPLTAGCTPTVPEPTPSATIAEAESPSPSETPSPTAAAPALVFTQPTTCSELAGPDLEAVFASRNIELFNSPNGEGMFAGGPVDTHQQGGNPFGCLWGVPYVDLNTFVLSSQPLSQSAHEGVVAILDGGGYVKTVDGDVVTYTQLGDELGQPSGQLTIHVLRPTSWITGWAALGGETSRVRMTEYLDAVAAHLYN